MNSSPAKNYYALLVGINDYPDPFSTLNGCIKDIDNIESYLRELIGGQAESLPESETEFAPGIKIKHYGPLHILRLADKQATHEHVTKGFLEFLSQAKKTITDEGKVIEDIVWFHFSGHGSQEYTAEEFLELEPNGKDQTLVCYNESYGTGLTNLADKELAALLYYVANKDPQGNRTQHPHIVVSTDCCHSGTITRHHLKVRQADVLPASTRSLAQKKGMKFRSLDSYANGFYSNQYKNQQMLEVPMAPHVVLSACENNELAGDLPEGGAFSLGLLKALKKANNDINYSDLYMQARTTVQKLRKNDQTPTFEIIGEFNAFQRFLDGSPLGKPDDYPLSYTAETWQIGCGAIHGIPLKSERPVLMDILLDGEVLGRAELTAIGAQKSNFRVIGDVKLDPKNFYKAHIHFLPIPPVLVWIHGEKRGLDYLKKHWDERKGIKWIDQQEEKEDATLEVEVKEGIYFLKDRLQKKQVFFWDDEDKEDGAKVMVDSLAKMVNWERTLKLSHEKSHILSQDWIELELKVTGKNPYEPIALLKDAENHLMTDEDTFISSETYMGVGFQPLWHIHAQNCKQELYAYLFHMRTDYSIVSYEGQKIFRPKEHRGKEKVVIPMWAQRKGWGLGGQDSEGQTFFKLLVTTEALDYQQLTQSGLAGDRLIDFDSMPMRIEGDWCSITMKVAISRP